MQGRSPIRTVEVTINKTFQDFLHSPGYQAGLDFSKVTADYALPYNVDAYYEIYESVVKVIQDVDPALILVDTMLAPGVCAAQELGRDHLLFTPSAIKDVITPQLGLAGLYRYPTRSARGAEYPMPIPAHVTPVGPIYRSTAPVSVIDPHLATWLAQKPTILINLGSHIKFTTDQTVAFVHAISVLLQHRNVQVLWKYRPSGTVPETAFGPIAAHIAHNTVRLEKWLAPDPAAILETGNVILFVHHGGSSSFNEASGSGVPAVVVPFWWDCYDFAVRAEWFGIGIWGTRKSAPSVDGVELSEALLSATGDGTQANKMREKVGVLAVMVSERGQGRRVAAREIVKRLDMEKQQPNDLRDEL
ncbi:hypothetical protein MBLNU457_2092t1 [Dothideomycetes sp. NU457]